MASSFGLGFPGVLVSLLGWHHVSQILGHEAISCASLPLDEPFSCFCVFLFSNPETVKCEPLLSETSDCQKETHSRDRKHHLSFLLLSPQCPPSLKFPPLLQEQRLFWPDSLSGERYNLLRMPGSRPREASGLLASCRTPQPASSCKAKVGSVLCTRAQWCRVNRMHVGPPYLSGG